MTIIVPSPHSGRPVKVRDQDVGRAVRDEAGRIFYIVPKHDGSGHYGALTRAGSLEDEHRTATFSQATSQEQPEPTDEAAPHDATGRRRSSWRGKLMIGLLLLVLVVLAVLYGWTPLSRWAARFTQEGGAKPPAAMPAAPPRTPKGNH